jgi:hypothetical protein
MLRARSEFENGRQFITDNGERSFWFFTWARWACIPLSLLDGTICFRWARVVRSVVRSVGVDVLALRAEHSGQRADDYADVT